MKNIKKYKNFIWIAGITIAVACIIIIIYGIINWTEGKSNKNNNSLDTILTEENASDDGAKASNDQVKTHREDQRDETNQEEKDQDRVNQEELNPDETKQEEANSEGNEEVSKEDAIEEDKEDPQVNNTSGEEIDVSQIMISDNETKDITYGIDVAKWQGIIEWSKVKEAGIDFAIIRVGYRTLDDGVIVEDAYAKYNLQEAKANGIKIGIYFFSTAINEQEAEEEAEWVANYIAPYPITYPVVYNCEGFTNPKNRQYELSKEARTDNAIAFLDTISQKGYTPMFYAAKSELENSQQWDTKELTKKYKIWVAQYVNTFDMENSISSYSGKHAMWQYTSNGKIEGIDASVDLNVAYFGYEETSQAKDDTEVETVTADPAALIQFEEVNEIVTAKSETNLRLVPNSEDDDSIVSTLKYGDSATRTGIGNNGWSRLEYDGEVVYAVSSYLTTDMEYQQNNTPTIQNPEAGIVFTQVEEAVTAKEKTNLRSIPSSESSETIVAVLYHGDAAVRTGIGDNGWSRVEYNGQILYAISSYLEEIEEP